MTAGPATSDRDIQTLRDAMAASQAGDFERAFALAEAALADGLTHPLFFKLRGLKHEREGALEAAVADFRAALADAPNDVAALNALGLCLARLGRAGEALAALDVATALEPGFAPAHVNRGWALETLGDPLRARDAYRCALDTDPDHARALAGLALIAARAGDPDEARARADRALALDSANPVARLALALTDLEAGDPAAAEGRARALLDSSDLPPHERGAALTVLGDALDAQDRAAGAFAAYAEANRTYREVYEPRFGTGGTQAGLGLVQRLTAYFDAAPAANWRRGPDPSRPAQDLAPRGHVFLLGFPRSGATLLGQVLAAHPDVVTLDERETLAEPARALMGDAGGLDRLAAMGETDLASWRGRYWRAIRDLTPPLEGKVLIDKLPMNTLGLPLIVKLFPDARVIFTRRDPRDVILSCFRRQFTLDATTYEFLTLEGAARFYDAVMRLADIYGETLEVDLDHRRHEDLVADFEAETRALCARLGLEWAPLAAFAEAAKSRGIATPSAIQVARGLYGEGVGRWRRYREQLGPVLPALTPWARRFGYAPD